MKSITRTRVIVALLWMISLLIVNQVSARQDGWLSEAPRVYSGADVGVRVYSGLGREGVTGRVVVRINGQWQEVEIKPVGQ